MLLTAIEIVVFMAAAAIVGVVLGWVLNGAFSREQTEIADLRAQLRQLKKANRESKVEKASTATVSATAGPAASLAAKAKPVKAKTTPKTPAKTGIKSAKRKTQAEREADQVAGRQAFAEVIGRVGKTDTQNNLTKIHGVGKNYATMLNDLDISSYAQISKLRKADVRTLAAALGVLDDRLETEDWVGSAKKLHKDVKK
jgi:predicted flap endonuclease-1-like 5' DNA nuclease